MHHPATATMTHCGDEEQFQFRVSFLCVLLPATCSPRAGSAWYHVPCIAVLYVHAPYTVAPCAT